jgi:hypothetical protein
VRGRRRGWHDGGSLRVAVAQPCGHTQAHDQHEQEPPGDDDEQNDHVFLRSGANSSPTISILWAYYEAQPWCIDGIIGVFPRWDRGADKAAIGPRGVTGESV